MDLPNELTWSVTNRLLTLGAMLGGLVLVGLGFVLGFWGSIDVVLNDPTNVDQAIEAANPIVTLALFAAGFLIWQFGKTYALFSTLPKASGQAAARRFDHDRVTNDVLEGLDERLTNIEVDLQETRRSVHELKRAEHASSFDLDADASSRAESEAGPGDTVDDLEAFDAVPSSADEPSDGPTSRGDTEFTFGETDDSPGQPADLFDDPLDGATDSDGGSDERGDATVDDPRRRE